MVAPTLPALLAPGEATAGANVAEGLRTQALESDLGLSLSPAAYKLSDLGHVSSARLLFPHL